MDVALMDKLEAIASEQEAQRKLLELVLEMQCPKCGPAAIVRMHPELGPQALKPDLALAAQAMEQAQGEFEAKPNGHAHDGWGDTGPK